MQRQELISNGGAATWALSRDDGGWTLHQGRSHINLTAAEAQRLLAVLANQHR